MKRLVFCISVLLALATTNFIDPISAQDRTKGSAQNQPNQPPKILDTAPDPRNCYKTSSGWYGEGQACLVKFTDGTRCVFATIGSGAGQQANPQNPARTQSIALQCAFSTP